MSQNISILQIDQNPGNWISQFLTSNGQKITNTTQDKITTLYLLQNANLLTPISLEDVLQVSPEFIKWIVLANKQSDQGDRTNRLVALVLLYNLGAISPDDHQYIKNPRFNEIFLRESNQPLTGNFLRSSLTLPTISVPIISSSKPVVATPFGTTAPKPVVATPFRTTAPKPVVATPFGTTAPKPVVATPFGTIASRPVVATPFGTTALKPVVATPFRTTASRPVVTTPERTGFLGEGYQTSPVGRSEGVKGIRPTIVEDNYKYMICQNCQAHIYNDEGICGLCDDEELFPEEILEEIQVEHYILPDPEYVDFNDYYDGSDYEDDDY